MTPPLSPVIAVIKGQAKKQMIKFCKKTNFEQFFNGCYCYLTVKPPKTVILINALEGAFFIQSTSNFMKRPDFVLVTKFSLNGGVKIKMLNNDSILTGKKYVVQIYKIKLHTKNHVDWIKNEVPREV